MQSTLTSDQFDPFLYLTHVLCRYSRDGTGIPLMGSLAECMFLPIKHVYS